MKNAIIWGLLFLLTTDNHKNNYISISHIGISDKSLYNIIIHSEGLKKPWYPDNYDTNKRDYDSLAKIVVCFNGYTTKPTTSFGVFKITKCNGSKNAVWYVDRKNAGYLFKSLLGYLNKNPGNEELKFVLSDNLSHI